MLTITRNSGIFILSPLVVAGGVEALFQLCDMLRDMGYLAYIVPQEGHEDVPERYKKYNAPIMQRVPQLLEEDVIIVPEIYTDKLASFSRGQKVIWWLGTFYGQDYKFEDPEVTHLTQSLNATVKVYERGGRQVYNLSTFIDPVFSDMKSERKDIILYNDKKFPEISSALINFDSNLKWAPVQGETVQDMKDLFNSAKVYVEMCISGRSRILREAIACGCCAFIRDQGSGYYFEDSLFPLKYKLDYTSVENTVERIKNILSNYDTCKRDFDLTRRYIALDKETMRNKLSVFLELGEKC